MQLAQQGPVDLQDQLELRALVDLLVHLGLRGLVGQVGQQDRPERPVLREALGHRDHLVLVGLQDHPDLLVQLGQLEIRVQLERQAHQVRLVLVVLQVQAGQLGLLDLQDPLDHQAQVGLQEQLGVQEQRELLE